MKHTSLFQGLITAYFLMAGATFPVLLTAYHMNHQEALFLLEYTRAYCPPLEQPQN